MVAKSSSNATSSSSSSSSWSIAKILNNQFASMAILLILVQVIRRLDLTSSTSINIIRLCYLCSQLLSVAFLFYIRSLIVKKADKSEKVEVDIPSKFGEIPTNPPARQKISVMDYDLMECNKQIQQIVSGMLILGILHWWLKFVQPLLIQSIVPWKNLLLTPLVRLYFWKARIDSDEALKRPWKVPNPFAELLGNMNQNTDGNGNANSSSSSNDSNRIHEIIEDESDQSEGQVENIKKNENAIKAVRVAATSNNGNNNSNNGNAIGITGTGPKGRKED